MYLQRKYPDMQKSRTNVVYVGWVLKYYKGGTLASVWVITSKYVCMDEEIFFFFQTSRKINSQ